MSRYSNKDKKISDADLISQLESDDNLQFQKGIDEGEIVPFGYDSGDAVFDDKGRRVWQTQVNMQGGNIGALGGYAKSLIKVGQLALNIRQGGLGSSSGYVPVGYEYVQDQSENPYTMTYNTYLNPPKLRKKGQNSTINETVRKPKVYIDPNRRTF